MFIDEFKRVASQYKFTGSVPGCATGNTRYMQTAPDQECGCAYFSAKKESVMFCGCLVKIYKKED